MSSGSSFRYACVTICDLVNTTSLNASRFRFADTFYFFTLLRGLLWWNLGQATGMHMAIPLSKRFIQCPAPSYAWYKRRVKDDETLT